MTAHKIIIISLYNQSKLTVEINLHGSEEQEINVSQKALLGNNPEISANVRDKQPTPLLERPTLTIFKQVSAFGMTAFSTRQDQYSSSFPESFYQFLTCKPFSENRANVCVYQYLVSLTPEKPRCLQIQVFCNWNFIFKDQKIVRNFQWSHLMHKMNLVEHIQILTAILSVKFVQ